MKTSSLLLTGCLVLGSMLWTGATADTVSLTTLTVHAAPPLPFPAVDCGGEPCDAVLRGLHAFFDRTADGLDGNGRACADCHMATDNFQLSPASAEERFQFLQWRRRGDPDADDPAVPADRRRRLPNQRRNAQRLQQSSPERSRQDRFTLPPNIRLIDPATNAASDETSVDVWRMVPTVNDVALTGPDGTARVAARSEPSGGYQLDARVTTLQEQALGALINHAQIQSAVRNSCSTICRRFERSLFTNHRVRALADAIRDGCDRLPDSDPPLNELEQQGKVVFERACTQCHGGPGPSTAQAAGGSLPRHLDAVSAPRRHGDAGPFTFAPCPSRLAATRVMRGTYEIQQAIGRTVRRTSSDPGRALLTGFVGGPAPPGRLEQVRRARAPRDREHRPYFHNNSADTLEDVVDHYIEFFKRVETLTIPGPAASPAASTDGVHFDRIRAGRTRSAAGVSAEALVLFEGLRPSDSPTASLARRFAARSAPLARSRCSLAPSVGQGDL